MKKIYILILSFSFTIADFAQKTPNPTIGKNEYEISLLYRTENNFFQGIKINLVGAQFVRRWSWMKKTKLGVGALAGIQDDPHFRSGDVIIGGLFGDITQFIGKRQKWNFGGKIGHGIFKRKQNFEDANYKITSKQTAGMFYSLSLGYRSVISKKVLIFISPVYTVKRNFRQKTIEEIFSPPGIYESKWIVNYSGYGLNLGIVF